MKQKTNVIQLFPSTEVADTLRCIADEIEAGKYEGEIVTMILDSGIVFHFGKETTDDGRAVEEAIFDMTVGTHLLMSHAVDYIRDHEEDSS